MRFALALLLFGLLLVWTGTNRLWIYYDNPRPVEMSIDEYVRTRPLGRWVKLTRLLVDYPLAWTCD